LLNLQSTAGYGKEANGDLLEGKRTLMLIYAMRTTRPSERRRLTRLLGKPRNRRSPRDVAWMRSLIDHTGAMDHARSVAKGLAGAALYEFEQIFDAAATSRSRDARFIRSMITWVLNRDT
jgi:geranylgeranyl diphosphate synthase type II